MIIEIKNMIFYLIGNNKIKKEKLKINLFE
jgi:hypothetical protein